MSRWFTVMFLVAPLAASVAPLSAQQRGALQLGRPVSDSLTDRDPLGRSRRAPYHQWAFEGRRGQKVVLDMVSSDFDPYLVVRDAEGYVVGSDDDSGEDNNARLRLILPRDGRYRVIATAYSESGRGRYDLTASGWEAPEAPAPGAAAPLRAEETKEGILEPGDETGGDGPFQDRWVVAARAGARLRVEMRSTDFDAYLIILAPDGRVIGTDDDGLGDRNAVFSLRAAAAGDYLVLATSYGDDPSVGVYSITLLEETGAFADPGVSSPIAAGEIREGRLEDGDDRGDRGLQDRWTFSGRAGEVVRLDVVSQVFDSYAKLLFGGTEVDSNDDGGEGNNARIMTVLPSTGDYTLLVTAYSEGRTGRYTVSLARAAAPPAPGQSARITPGQRLAGRLEAGDRERREGGNEDVWEFDGRAGQNVMIELRSGAFDTYLELTGPDGESIAENDDGLGEGTDSFILAQLPRRGRYVIHVRVYGDRTAEGFYELSLALAPPAAPPGRVTELRPSETLVGRLERGDSLVGDSTYADIYLFRPARSGEITVALSSGDFDAFLILQDASGRTLATDDDTGSGTDSELSYRVRAGETYRILANSYGEEPETGVYRITLRIAP
jgi:hypothetical protein